MGEFDDAVIIDREDISNYNTEQLLPETPQTIENIRRWLQPTEYDIHSGEYRKHLASHVPGTGSWLTTSNIYQQWLRSEEHGFLWIRGIPGSRKSVIAAHVINELTRSYPGTPVLYFFFRQIIDANHEPVALLRDWQDEVLKYSPPLQKRLKKLFSVGRKVDDISVEEHWKNIRLALENISGKVFCVADALDEMNSGNDSFLEALGQLGHRRPDKVKVLITSRPVPSVEVPLRSTKGFRLRLDEKMVNADIAHYVQACLETSSVGQQDRERIMKAVPGRADGLFLYAKLAMDAFLEPGASVDEVLQQLPLDLNDLYTSLLEEHARRSDVPHDIQLQILQWVTHATRPLRLLEVAEMINITTLLPSEKSLKRSKDLVRAAIGPLLEVLPDESLCVVHHSFTEFLKGSTRLEEDTRFPVLHHGFTHQRLAEACLEYLQSGCLEMISVEEEPELNNDKEDDNDHYVDNPHDESGDSIHWRDVHVIDREDSENVRQAKLSHAFLEYAAANWHVQARRSIAPGTDQTKLNTTLDSFLGNDRLLRAWLTLHLKKEEGSVHRVTPLHVAAQLDLEPYVCHLLLLKSTDINARDAAGKTSLWWAAKCGHADIVSLLVGKGADVDQADKQRGLRPLHIAALGNHHDAVRVLLETGVDPLTKRNSRKVDLAEKQSTALTYACRSGHLETLEMFLPFLDNADAANRALVCCAQFGHERLVERLIQHPRVDMNSIIDGYTPLVWACEACDKETISVLVESGADATICGEEQNVYTARLRLTDIAKTKDPSRGYTPLHALFNGIPKGSVTIPLTRPIFTKSPLTPEDYLDLIERLAQKGVDLHKRSNSGCTALHFAAQKSNLSAVRRLIQSGADVNAVDDTGAAPVHQSIGSPDLLTRSSYRTWSRHQPGCNV